MEIHSQAPPRHNTFPDLSISLNGVNKEGKDRTRRRERSRETKDLQRPKPKDNARRLYDGSLTVNDSSRAPLVLHPTPPSLSNFSDGVVEEDEESEHSPAEKREIQRTKDYDRRRYTDPAGPWEQLDRHSSLPAVYGLSDDESDVTSSPIDFARPITARKGSTHEQPEGPPAATPAIDILSRPSFSSDRSTARSSPNFPHHPNWMPSSITDEGLAPRLRQQDSVARIKASDSSGIRPSNPGTPTPERSDNEAEYHFRNWPLAGEGGKGKEQRKSFSSVDLATFLQTEERYAERRFGHHRSEQHMPRIPPSVRPSMSHDEYDHSLQSYLPPAPTRHGPFENRALYGYSENPAPPYGRVSSLPSSAPSSEQDHREQGSSRPYPTPPSSGSRFTARDRLSPTINRHSSPTISRHSSPPVSRRTSNHTSPSRPSYRYGTEPKRNAHKFIQRSESPPMRKPFERRQSLSRESPSWYFPEFELPSLSTPHPGPSNFRSQERGGSASIPISLRRRRFSYGADGVDYDSFDDFRGEQPDSSRGTRESEVSRPSSMRSSIPPSPSSPRLMSTQDVVARQGEPSKEQQEWLHKEVRRRLERLLPEAVRNRPSKELIGSTLELHERQWNVLLSPIATNLQWGSIPWPMFTSPKSPADITLAAVTTYLRPPVHPREKDEPQKDRLRLQIRRWHPDGFETKCLPRVVESDRQKVKEGVGAVFRSLTDILTREWERAFRPGPMNDDTVSTPGETSQLKTDAEARQEEEFEIQRQEVQRREDAVKQREYEMRQVEKEVSRREDAARRKEEEIGVKLRQKEDELRSREQAAKAREEELERLIATAQESAILIKLRSIFVDVTARHYRRLLTCVGSDAQTIFDTFQLLLDTDRFPDRGQLVVAMQRLSAKTQLYPKRYFLEGHLQLVEDSPVTGGRFGDIYKARFQGELTCLKVIRAHERQLVQHMAKTYAREAILWGQLSHMNVLPFFGLYPYRSQIAFVAPWAEKGNLRQYLAQEPHANRILLCADTAAGVEYLHANNVVHGDLKALNILVDGSGRACLGDFGLSGVSDKDILQWATQSAAASKSGTTRWQAPELHDPEASSTHNTKESDIFAWASTSYEIFTGNLPFSGVLRETTVALMILRGDLPTRPHDQDPSCTDRGLTEEMWGLLKDCWKMKPSERPDISTVVSRLKDRMPDEDPRPPGQWGPGLAMRFRNAQSGPDKRSLLEDLDAVLSKILDESVSDDGAE
ncbi:hypothetical protein DXG01_002389 [Tephrocybe rancida]|nr:hypothetical protein DXG01_002389 [Tephrocybe rancida]